MRAGILLQQNPLSENMQVIGPCSPLQHTNRLPDNLELMSVTAVTTLCSPMDMAWTIQTKPRFHNYLKTRNLPKVRVTDTGKWPALISVLHFLIE